MTKQEYKKYLQSKHWRDFRNDYKKSGLPQKCISCDNEKFELHHRSYKRLGHENILDVIPLCRHCHESVHERVKNKKDMLHTLHATLRKINHWTRREMWKRFKPYSINGHVGKFVETNGERHERIKKPIKLKNYKTVKQVSKNRYIKLIEGDTPSWSVDTKENIRRMLEI